MEGPAGRCRKSEWPLIEMKDALRITAEQTDDVHLENEQIEPDSLLDAIGHVLYDDVVAKEPHPMFPASIKDGYAVLASDGIGVRRVIAVTSAGEGEVARLVPGTCARVSTGCLVPQPSDAVVQVEDTRLIEQKDGEEIAIEILVPPKVGQDIRPIGSDIREKEIVLTRGSLIGSTEIGILATVGCLKPSLYRKPRVAVLSTGNEIVDQAEMGQLPVGCVRDSNRPQLLALLRAAGFEAVDFGIVKDQFEDIKNRVMSALTECDVLVTSGGVSMGEKDLLKAVLQEGIRFTIHFGRVRMKPGKPTTFASGTLNSGEKRWVWAVPGNPVSARVTAQLFLLPSLRRLAKHPRPNMPVIPVRTDRSLTLDGRVEYARAHLHQLQPSSGNNCCLPRGNTVDDPFHPPMAILTDDNQISSRLINARAADLLLILPPKTPSSTVLPAHSIVNAALII